MKFRGEHHPVVLVLYVTCRKQSILFHHFIYFFLFTSSSLRKYCKVGNEMFLAPPFIFLCGGRLPDGMNKNSHNRVSICIVSMVITIDHASLRPMF